MPKTDYTGPVDECKNKCFASYGCGAFEYIPNSERCVFSGRTNNTGLFPSTIIDNYIYVESDAESLNSTSLYKVDLIRFTEQKYVAYINVCPNGQCKYVQGPQCLKVTNDNIQKISNDVGKMVFLN